jgi:drug/metabolite transporter (DMT)-like permease
MIDLPVGLALGALACNGLADVVYKRAATDGVRPHHLMLVQSCCYGMIVLAYGLATGKLVWNLPALWGAVAGAFAFTGFYNFAQSLRGGAVTINAPIFRLSFVITAVLAVAFLGEAVTVAKLAGLVFALVAVWLLLGAPAAEMGRAQVSRASLVRVLVATATVGIANLVYKIGTNAGATPAGILVVQACTVISLSLLFNFINDGRVRPAPQTYRHAIPAAILLSASFTLLIEALARGAASTLVPIAQLGFVVTAIIGVTFLRERLTARKLAGLSAAVLALGSLALS